jgi:hypothetical protein
MSKSLMSVISICSFLQISTYARAETFAQPESTTKTTSYVEHSEYPFLHADTKECEKVKRDNPLFNIKPTLSGGRFVGNYGKFKYSKTKMISGKTKIKNLADKDGNFLVFRIIRAPFDPNGVSQVKEGVSYSLSPSIAKHWGDDMLDRSGNKRYWLLIGENNLRQSIHPGQNNNLSLRLSKDSFVVTKNTGEVGLNEIKVEPHEQNIVAAIPGDQLDCLYSQIKDEFTATQLIKLLVNPN